MDSNESIPMKATRMNPSDAFEHDKKAINNFTAELYSQLLNVQIKKLSQPKHDFTGKKRDQKRHYRAI